MSNTDVSKSISSDSIYSYSNNSILKSNDFTRISLKVKQVLGSRYRDFQRPASWDYRRDGIDIILPVIEEGNDISEYIQNYNSYPCIFLWSDGGQSTPKTDWTIILTKKISLSDQISGLSLLNVDNKQRIHTPEYKSENEFFTNNGEGVNSELKNISKSNINTAYTWTLYGISR